MIQTLVTVSLLISIGPARAVEPHEKLNDPVLEARARDLSRIICCLVCQNQSIDESNAELAADLRVILRERLVAGDSDQTVLEYLVARYGDFVLLKPPFKPVTYLLSFGSAIFLALAVTAAALYFRRRRSGGKAEGDVPLSSLEQARLDRILARDADRK